MFHMGLNSRVVKLGLLILGISVAGTAMSQSVRDQQIAERLAPAGQVCLAGEDCASGAPAATSTAAASSAAFDAGATYDQYCAMCHNTGMAGAPRREDADHWTARVAEAGFGTIVNNAINGVNAMPPRGMCATCSDDDIASLVEYLSGASAE
tara:strand:- start:19023 stop:19478 length:456 start_codon:yes stop_codon:yes gene_type:complete